MNMLSTASASQVRSGSNHFILVPQHSVPCQHSQGQHAVHVQRRTRQHISRRALHVVMAVVQDAVEQADSAQTAPASQPEPRTRAYDASSIQVLEGLEPVRKRPGMYIGSTGSGGLHHLVYEVVDNCIDEIQGGHATRVEVEVDLGTGWVTVTDDGRGIPTDVHPATGKSALETVLTVLHAGGKFGGEASGYKVSGGLHGVGISVVNALSEHTIVKVWRDGQQYSMSFSRGAVQNPLVVEDLPECDQGRQGTQVRFLYDRTIFSRDAKYDPDTLRTRLRELAFLNSNATVLLKVIPAPEKGGRRGAGRARSRAAGQPAQEAENGNGHQHSVAAAPGQSVISHVCSWQLGDPLPPAAGGEATSQQPQVPQHSQAHADRDVQGSVVAHSQDEADGDSDSGNSTDVEPPSRTPGIAESEEAGDSHAQLQPAPEVHSAPHQEAVLGAFDDADGQPDATDSHQGLEVDSQAELPTAIDSQAWRDGHQDLHSDSVATVSAPVVFWSDSLDGVHVGDGWHVYHFEGGLREFVTSMNQAQQVVHDVMYFHSSVEGVGVEVALQWCASSFSDTVVGFANSIRTVDGGMHLDGTRAAITRTINALAKKHKLVKDSDPSLTGDHIREGLVGCVSVKVPNPEFEGQTKTRLGNPEVKRILDATVSTALGEWLELHPAALSAIVNKALTAARAADAAKKARDLVRRKAVLTRTTLPGKLADCTSSKKSETEIFVVEGDSAGGSAKQARDRHTQAILPLRGKILNVERKDEGQMLRNQEISNLIVALGLGSKSEGCQGLRYGKVIILTDADVDGAHIRTLLLTFLFRYRPELFTEGHVYVAVPPLYKVESQGGKRITWCHSDQDKQQVISGLEAGKYTIQRFKGLGEMMPDQLWETTLDPARRTLRKLTVKDAKAASQMFNTLMGTEVAPRRSLIQEKASLFTLQDLDI